MPISFIYRPPGKDPQKHTLIPGWHESGFYLCGVDEASSHYKTFRKDRVVSYLDGAELRLALPTTPPPPKVKKGSSESVEILFTGFAAARRSTLEAQAEEVGMHICKTVTTNLTFLCTGPNAGPSKVEKARSQRVFIVSEAQFLALIETGELPDEQHPA